MGERKMRLFSLTVATAFASDQIKLSYGAFDAHYCEPLEMAPAIEHCKKLNGRLPRFNNHDDYNSLGALYAKYGLTHTWSSFIDGTVTGTVEYDGTGKWSDFYDKDQVDFFNWQTTPTIQPNEPGTSCTEMFFYGLDDVKNGLGDCPCRAVTGDECYYKTAEGEIIPFDDCSNDFFCLVPVEQRSDLYKVD